MTSFRVRILMQRNSSPNREDTHYEGSFIEAFCVFIELAGIWALVSLEVSVHSLQQSVVLLGQKERGRCTAAFVG